MSELTTPTPSAESMEDFKQDLEASFRQIKEGDILTGTVIGVSETEATLDLQYYTDGIIRLEDFTEDPSFSIKADVEIGQEISAIVIATDDGKGRILLSKKDAAQILAWTRLQELMESRSDLTVKIAGVVNAGVICYVEGIRGFIPASKLSLNFVEDLNEWLHKEINVRIITVDKDSNKLVLSAKEILREKEAANKSQIISNIEVGLVTEGVVDSIQPYGAFVQLSNGASGLLHVSQISEKRIKTPAAVLNLGDTITVKVIAIKEGKLSLSMKALHDVSAEKIYEERVKLPKSESISTNLGALLEGIQLD